MLTVFSHKGNTNQNYSKIPCHSSRNIIKTKETMDAGTGQARSGRGHGLTQEDLQLEATVTHYKSRLMKSHLKLSVEIKLVALIKN